MRLRSLALPVRITSFSDSSQVLTLFTREAGIVEAIAKGSHREKNAFQGPFDLAVLWEVMVAERTAERGLSVVTEGWVVEGFRGARATLARWSAAAYLLEHLRAVGTAGEPPGELFDLAVALLTELSRPRDRNGGSRGAEEAFRASRVLAAYEARALRLLGFTAPAEACAGCGRPWSRSDRMVFFSLGDGGILCAPCRAALPSRAGQEGSLPPASGARRAIAGRRARFSRSSAPSLGLEVPGSAIRDLETYSSLPVPPVEELMAEGGGARWLSEPPSLSDRQESSDQRRRLGDLSSLLREIRNFSLEHDFRTLESCLLWNETVARSPPQPALPSSP